MSPAAMRALERITRTTEGSDMVVAIGVPIVFGHLLYNCAAVVQNGRVLGVILAALSAQLVIDGLRQSFAGG